MSRSVRPTPEQVRDVYRLIGDVRALRGDGLAQRRVLVDGACALVGADEGFFVHFADWRVGRVPRGVSTVHGSVTDNRVVAFTSQFYAENAPSADAMGAGVFDATAHGPSVGAYAWSDVRRTRVAGDYPAFYDLTRELRFADILDPAFTDDDGNAMALSLHRLGSGARVFSAREKALAAVLAAELKWLQETGRLDVVGLLGDPPEPPLPPRLRDVYRLLLTDLSGKQIAAQLKLSPHTVREYIDQVYKRLGVGSRQELLVRFLRPA